ncbi:PREDICTED: fasciclin-like arabinogalactan protein 19 [Camelina sativa]|uniref:Fasciclin-like arabinogalactan protein 19 n=1 Tax=Camelina sativa TaxID=90675 RepID=A0ABM0VNZ8_CAMSA|nr:PREDICTED: fasciclin-like arabinogalactan protein 19 [Camelina sativa]
MANISSASCFRAIFLGALIILLLCLPHPSAGVPLEELERAIAVLRVRGRALFANAIITSDLLFDLLSDESLTLFAPTDSMLFALDMTHSLPFYVSTLRLHSVPLRLPLSELRSLPNASSLPTLLPSHRLLLTKPSSSNDSIFLDGVQLLLPGLFVGQHIAVHGLATLLPLTPPSSPNRLVEDSAAASPWILGSRFSPAPEPYFAFMGLSPAESPSFEQVPPSPSWGEDFIVGDEGGPLDATNNGF